ncbi:1-acyl-sn-glycerol-3-phosphate acyltransferase [Macrococcus sp. DPC7161]|uniref:lysophospholipid acyltransferase family protein n=1 Tax=Macrococcus sp. DPC7161 TaxID=2507060 RepID=UPI00100B0074|nr:lysophospholipid acyltransferase family protein [Macrococcus sp. DPC7161]RXK18263.1 1-acyl-sn-glycerol-3-phosphate acyltransferase [Macrococcus sp. DPC7161]
MYSFLARILYIILVKLFKKVKVKGLEHIPKNGGYIVTCNHTSMVEIIILAMALYPIEVHYMAKQELFKNKFLNQFFKSVNAFPVNRENPGPSSLKTPIKLLKQDQVVGIFPSGSRTEGAPLKKGAATMAYLAKSTILPAKYEGPTRFRDIFKKQGDCYIIFGEIIDTTKIEGHNKSEIIDNITAVLEQTTHQLQK